MALATELDEDVVVVVPEWARSAMAQPTYSEARTWFEWTQIFVPSDIADSMGVSNEVAERYIRAGVWHGIIIQTDDFDGREYIYEYVPLPPGPRYHPHYRPEWQSTPGCGELAPVRGLPIRLQKDDRKEMSTPGSRGRAKRREARYKQMQQAVAARREKQRAAEGAEPKWKRNKTKVQVVNWS